MGRRGQGQVHRPLRQGDATWSSATRAATTPGTRSSSTARRFALQLDPERRPLRPHHPGHRQRRGRRPRGAARRDRHARAAGASTAAACKVSANAHLILPYHQELDRVHRAPPRQEQARHDQARHRPGLRRQGGPRRPAGAGPARPQDLPRRSSSVVLQGEEPDPGQGLQPAAARRRRDLRRATSTSCAPRLEPYVADTVNLVHEALEAGQHVLLEGAQATFLDLDHGTYPFVTSSNPVAGGACTGAGIGPRYIDRVIGIAKAYVTRVGVGPVPHRAVRRGRRPARRPRPRVRHQHRAAPPAGLVRRGDAAPRGAPQLAVRGRAHQARRARRASTRSRCASPTRSTASASTACPYHQSVLHKAHAGLRGAARLEHRPRRRSPSPATCPPPRADYVAFLEEQVGVPIRLVGVGPGRDQYVQRTP